MGWSAESVEGVVQVLLAEKHYEAAGGLELDETMVLAIAAQAALLQMRPRFWRVHQLPIPDPRPE